MIRIRETHDHLPLWPDNLPINWPFNYYYIFLYRPSAASARIMGAPKSDPKEIIRNPIIAFRDLLVLNYSNSLLHHLED